ncbi:MAG: hypothetical protein AAB229_09535 [Candidatus Hydrogenedentota bacterium]
MIFTSRFFKVIAGLAILFSAACSAQPTGIDLEKLDDASRHAVRRAVELVMEAKNVRAEDVEVLSAEAVDWPDSSLGLPEPGMMYAQVITPGHRVRLKAKTDEILEVHTSGTRAILKH